MPLLMKISAPAVPECAAERHALGRVRLHPVEASSARRCRPSATRRSRCRGTSAMRRISPGMSASASAKCTKQHVRQRADRPPGPHVLPERPERMAVPRRASRGSIARMSTGGGSIGGPTRPGVSFSASYQVALALAWWLYMLQTTSRPSRADVEVLRLRREDERVDRQVRLEEPPVRLRLDAPAASPPSAARADRATATSPRPSRSAVAVEQQLRDDLLHPGRARLGVGRDDDVVVAESKIVPDRRVEVVVVELARLPGPFGRVSNGRIAPGPIAAGFV